MSVRYFGPGVIKEPAPDYHCVGCGLWGRPSNGFRKEGYSVDNKCPDCGRFANHFNPVWGPTQWSGFDREVCDDCYQQQTTT